MLGVRPMTDQTVRTRRVPFMRSTRRDHGAHVERAAEVHSAVLDLERGASKRAFEFHILRSRAEAQQKG